MTEQGTKGKLSEEERLKQMAAQMRAEEYKGLSEEEIRERERQKEMRKKENIGILNDTLNILEQGCYEKAGRNVKLGFSQEQMRKVQVFLPQDIELLRSENISSAVSDEARAHGKARVQKGTPTQDESRTRGETQAHDGALTRGDAQAHADARRDDSQSRDTQCVFHCENTDALVLAQKKYQELKENGDAAPRILVLNLASATHPGGHTRKGAGAQEEDLCRRTSLLLSLESKNAKKYYDYNNARKTRMGSDAVLLSPYVDVVKNSSAETLAEPFPISVMSCGAPMVRLGLEGMSQQEYEEMLCKRIQGILLVAASQNYRHLILGAFGCGVYGNDAATVSDLFARAIRSLTYAGKDSSRLFSTIDFAVLCPPDRDYNYREFCRNFSV